MNIKTEIQPTFDYINNWLNVIENNMKSSISDQVNESMLNIKDSNTLKDDNRKLHSKVEDLEMKLYESELSLNRLDLYNQRNYIEVQVIP